jgi:hypothetical protein
MRNKGEDQPGSSTFSATEMKHQAQEAGSALAEKAQDFASTAAEKAQGAASTVAHKAGEVASNVGHKAEDAVSAVGGGMKSLAGTIRENAPQGGMFRSASSTVADTLEDSGRYLQEHGLSGLGRDLTNMIRRNPLPALLIGVGLGYLIAQATRSRS